MMQNKLGGVAMNRFAKQNKERAALGELILPICFFILIVVLVLWGIQDVKQSTSRQQLVSTEEAVRRATAQCYAVEGQYPQNVSYLEEHYGLLIDHDKYIVHYMGFASNLMPDIKVLPKQGADSTGTSTMLEVTP